MSIPRGAVKGISFDYGHVLGGLDLDELASRLIEEHGVRATGVAPALRAALPAAYRAHDDAIAAGLGHEQGWRALMGVLVATAMPRTQGGAGFDDDARARAVDALWRAQPNRNLWRWVPAEARALLAELDRAGVPMVITSNSEGRVAELLDEVGIAHHFVSILDSGRLGFAKPDRRMFARAAEALGLPIEALVHVGDSEAADVVGAKRAGAWAVRYDGFVPGVLTTGPTATGPTATGPTAADARAKTYAELRAILLDAWGAASGLSTAPNE